MSTIKLKVITPERVFFEGEVEQFIVKGRGDVGDFAVLPNHSPLTATIGYGKLQLTISPEEVREATLFGGYALVHPDHAIILVDVAEWPEEIDLHRAMEARKRAEEALAKSDADFNRARISLTKALVRIDLANVSDKINKEYK